MLFRSEYAIGRYGRSRNLHPARFGDFALLRPCQPVDLLVCSDVLHYLPTRELDRGLPGLAALCGGVALYLLGHNAFRLREVGSVSVPRVVVTVLCLALIPVAVSIPSLVILAILAGLMCALVAFETMRSREFRRELRAQ